MLEQVVLWNFHHIYVDYMLELVYFWHILPLCIGLQRTMDSPYHPHCSGSVVESSGAATPPVASATELDFPFFEFQLTSQHLPGIHPHIAGILRAMFLSHCTLPGARFAPQCSIHSSESMEWQSGGSHPPLLSSCVPSPTHLCCH